MKHRLWMILLAALTVGAWAEAGETLALTVHYDNGDPNETRSVWTDKYYVDAQDRLVHWVRVTRSDFVGEPDTTQESRFHWEGLTVTWAGSSFRGMMILGDGGMSGLLGDYSSWWTIEKEGNGVRLKGEGWEATWYSDGGYQRSGRVGYVTQGARITKSVEGRVSDFVIVDRRPGALTATFYGSYVSDDEWVPTGTVTLSGAGLPHSQPEIALFHSQVLERLVPFPVSAPFVCGGKR
jgi:hypothetical protein